MRIKKPILIGIAAVAALGGWELFRPELLFVNNKVNETLNTTNIVKSGTFDSYAHETKGTAQVVKENGMYVLQLKDFHTSNGPDVRVYLVKDSDANAASNGKFVDLGSIKGNIGNQKYNLPAGTNPNDFNSIAIWCKRFNVGFGGATLSSSKS